jgi:hypothetical protein
MNNHVPSPVIGRAWALYEAFRKLGYKHEQVWVSVNPDVLTGHLTFYTVLLPDGEDGPRFNAAAGPVYDVDVIEREWREWKTAVADGDVPDSKLRELWFEHFPTEEILAELVMALRNKGMRAPALES